MRPHPASTMSVRAAWAQVKVPVRLTPMIRAHPSAVMSRTGVKASMPALVTRISTGPSSALIRSKPVSTDVRSATSTSTAMAVAPSPRSLRPRSPPPGRRGRNGDPIAVVREPVGDPETDARGPAGDDGDAAHRRASAASNSRCKLERPRSIQVGSYRKVRSPEVRGVPRRGGCSGYGRGCARC